MNFPYIRITLKARKVLRIIFSTKRRTIDLSLILYMILYTMSYNVMFSMKCRTNEKFGRHARTYSPRGIFLKRIDGHNGCIPGQVVT